MSEDGEAERDLTIGEAVALGNLAQQKGKRAEAAEIYRRVLEAWPECPDALHFSGLLAFTEGRRDEGVALVERSLTLAPENEGFWNNFGNVLKEQEKIPEAAAAYEHAIELNPDFADAQHNLGVVASLQNDHSRAIEAYQKVLAAEPNRADTHRNLGNALEKLNRLDESIAAFRAVIALKPADPAAYGRLGYILWRQGKFDEATEAIRQTIKLNPKDPLGFGLLAGILHSAGHTDEAFEAYEKALEIDPTNHYVNFLYGQTLSGEGKPERARAVWKRWSEADPENPIPRHLFSAGADEGVPERGADDYIVRVFDRFAESFDAKLKNLEYKAPELVVGALRSIYPEPGGSLHILDAGCGTGLCGPLLRPFARRLDGVDLSSKMLEKAAARGGYDELVAAELTAFTAEREDIYDVIACADTLCYFGKLEAVMAAAAKALQSGGYFIFTLEKTPPTKNAVNFTLEHSGRYTHTEPYARSVIAGAGMEVAQLNCKALRKELFVPVEGMVVVARKPAA